MRDPFVDEFVRDAVRPKTTLPGLRHIPLRDLPRAARAAAVAATLPESARRVCNEWRSALRNLLADRKAPQYNAAGLIAALGAAPAGDDVLHGSVTIAMREALQQTSAVVDGRVAADRIATRMLQTLEAERAARLATPMTPGMATALSIAGAAIARRLDARTETPTIS